MTTRQADWRRRDRRYEGSQRSYPRLMALGLIPLLLFLAACEEDAPPPVETVRAIKTVTVADRASGTVRKFAGIVEAVDTSSLSFEVTGNVQELQVERGDSVQREELLARLDDEPFKLAVEGAEASLGRAKAEFAEATTEFQRQETLFQKGWVAKAAYDQALASYRSAENNVKYQQSQLNLAKRDLEKTVLIAPFDGIISERHVDAFQEVNRGEPIFDVYAEGAMQVHLSVPETSIREIHLGLPAEFSFPTRPGLVLEGRVTEIGTVAEAANAFPVKIALLEGNGEVLPGMTAEAALLLGGEEEATSYLVPVSAIAPGKEPRVGYIFVFDADSSTVHQVEVRSEGVRDNQVVISEGLEGGDIIAVAGVSFLSDGQRVKLMQP